METEKTLKDLLFEALEGSDEVYDIDDLKSKLNMDSRFDEIDIDSLDLIEFFLRVGDTFGIKIRQEDYTDLISLAAVETHIEELGTC